MTALLLAACVADDIGSRTVAEQVLPTQQYQSPPSEAYFKINQLAIVDELLQSVNVTNAQLSLREAIHATLPFSVVVRAADVAVDLTKVYSIRTNKEMRVADFLAYLEGLSNYRITLNPANNIVEVAAYITRQWNLAAIASASLNRIYFGSATATDDDSDLNSSVDAELSISSRMEYGDKTPWQTIVEQANCIMKTRLCEEDIFTDSTSDFADDDDGFVEELSWVQADQRTGLLVASGPIQEIKRLAEWLNPLQQKSTRMVQMEVLILDVANNNAKVKLFNLLALNDSGRIGLSGGSEETINLTAGGWVIDSDFSINGNNFDVLLNNFDNEQDIQVLHRTNLIAANGGVARINSVETFSYAGGQEIIPGDANNQQRVSASLQQAQIGLELTVMPQLLADDKILLTVIPALSSLIRLEDIVSGGVIISKAPRISLTNLSSKAITRSGRAVPVGGLTTKQISDNVSASLGLDRTVLGDLFTSKDNSDRRRELVVIVLPREISV
ncbi:MAG: hypothetical protein GDA45_00760 [Chromatiales bacterium]|nr:hypothetical protein [Chromatiales bacterium]